MSTATARPPLRQVRVAPTVTDPTMRNSRGPAEMLLNSETGDTLDDEKDREVVFGGSSKTKEEQDVVSDSTSPNSTMLIIVFALIVIALVALIVWMVMKQSNDKRDEDEVRRVIQPTAHPRNNMPPNYGPRPGGNHPQGNEQNDRAAYEEHQRNMAMMHQQQQDMQQNMAQLNAKLKTTESNDESVEKPQKKKKNKSFAETMSEKDGKQVPTLKEPLLDEEAPPEKAKFSKKNPHPNIMRPGNQKDRSDVDDILEQTQTMMSKKSKNKPAATGASTELTDLDKALLDKVSTELNNMGAADNNED